MVSLEKKVDDQWNQALMSTQICRAILHGLQPGDMATGELRLHEALEAGEYRIMATLENMQTYERREHYTNTFVVTP